MSTQGNHAENDEIYLPSSISSPASTGGAGTFFEQHVAAYWLAQLLVRGIPPILIDTKVSEIHFQTEHLGWNTDDFLVHCEAQCGAIRKLAGQVKRRFTVSATDPECKKAIQDFWRDFKNPKLFCPSTDKMILVTLRGTDTLLEHLSGLLDFARSARSSEEFAHRLAINGLVSKRAVRYCEELQTIISEIERSPPAIAEIWPLLCVLHVISLDLTTSTRQTEAQIKNLLAHTAAKTASTEIATNTWNALLTFASTAMSEARSIGHADLPETLKVNHSVLGSKEHDVLRALINHSEPVLRKIQSKIGRTHNIRRDRLKQKVLEALEISQVVVVSGPAGCGKSALAKEIFAHLSQTHFAFGFRVEEFAQPHIDTALQAVQIPANAVTLTAILAAQNRKVLLIESGERLLEKTTRDAFSDLMNLIAEDKSLTVILTCRDYSVEQMRASFLRPASISHEIVNIPPLNDQELAEVETALPNLSQPLRNPNLREIVRNPYFLDKATLISWSPERPIPESEREFRALFWKQIVRAELNVPSPTARQREVVFQEIAVRRARALSAYVTSNNLDSAAVAALKQDSLIVSPEDSPTLVATAHDVLEDWAILNWFEEKRLADTDNFSDLASEIGTHPAIRRSYRKWIAELLIRNPSSADRLFNAAISNTALTAQFRDDTLISLLKADKSPQFLMQNAGKLLANDNFFLKRLIHLLRVACVTTPHWMKGGPGHGSIYNVPDGPAWSAILNLVHQNLGSFTQNDCSLLIGLLEDAVRSVSIWSPNVDGAQFVASIGHWLLARLDNYRSRESCNRVLKVLAKIPTADAAKFESVLQGKILEGRRRDVIADNFRKILFSDIDGTPAARDLPDLLIAIASKHFLASDNDQQQHSFYRSSIRLETHFGLQEGSDHDHFPASALRGPWFALVRFHPLKAFDFFISIFDHCTDWYVKPRVSDPLEPAWKIPVTFSDGTQQIHWGNARLWNLYRGTSVGPYALQSMLMALEMGLLELAANSPAQLDSMLLDILRRTRSSALAAVVASVATAFPRSSAETLLVLLSAPDYIRLDRGRMATEFQSSMLTDMLPNWSANTKIFDGERKKENQKPHRRRDLEMAVLNLQLGPSASKVHSILDKYIAALQQQPTKNEEDLLWKLALNRMDIRQYDTTEMSAEALSQDTTQEGKAGAQYLQLVPKAYEPALQALVENSVEEQKENSSQLEVLNWANSLFQQRQSDQQSQTWKDMLNRAKAMESTSDGFLGADHAPGFVAAVCTRDYWDLMKKEDQEWCCDTICSVILERKNSWSHYDRVQRFPIGADRPCAFVVPLLLMKSLSTERTALVHQAFAASITHPIDEVCWHAIRGIDKNFWACDPKLAMRCVNAIALEVELIDQRWEENEKLPYEQRREFDDICSEAANIVRQSFWNDGAIKGDGHATVKFLSPTTAKISSRMLAVLGEGPEDALSVAAFTRASEALVNGWELLDLKGSYPSGDYRDESVLSDTLEKYLMRVSFSSASKVLKPIVQVLARFPRETHYILDGLTVIEDRQPNTSHYWSLWGAFASGIKNAKWIAHLSEDHSTGHELISSIFLGVGWKSNIRHWKSLEGYAEHVHSLFIDLPPSSVVLNGYVRFLYQIGEHSLPDAFVFIRSSLEKGGSINILSNDNTAFMLEVLLQRHVYGRPMELKRESTMRDTILFLLDTLVERGSSEAFRMRDDFVTPNDVVG